MSRSRITESQVIDINFLFEDGYQILSTINLFNFYENLEWVIK